MSQIVAAGVCPNIACAHEMAIISEDLDEIIACPECHEENTVFDWLGGEDEDSFGDGHPEADSNGPAPESD